MSAALSTICENIYDFADHYRCSTALYLMPMFPKSFSVIIYRGISALGNGR